MGGKIFSVSALMPQARIAKLHHDLITGILLALAWEYANQLGYFISAAVAG
jgi:hypothetical protein